MNSQKKEKIRESALKDVNQSSINFGTLIKEFSEGNCLGEITLFDGSFNSFTMVALTKLELIKIDSKEILLKDRRCYPIARSE